MTFQLRLIFWALAGAGVGYFALDGLGLILGAMLGAARAGTDEDVDLFV